MSTLNERWGDETMGFGFTAVPNLLLRINCLKETKGSERVTSAEMFVLLIILSHWMDSRRHPYPSIERVARFSGLSNRHVRRIVKELADKNYLIRERHGEFDGRSNSYNPRPLVQKLSAAAKILDADTALIQESVARLEIADRLGLFSRNLGDSSNSGSAAS
jgi:AraC-like DNA-binding protein